jgi:hypothetical protein
MKSNKPRKNLQKILDEGFTLKLTCPSTFFLYEKGTEIIRYYGKKDQIVSRYDSANPSKE